MHTQEPELGLLSRSLAYCIKGRFSALGQQTQPVPVERHAETHFRFCCYRTPYYGRGDRGVSRPAARSGHQDGVGVSRAVGEGRGEGRAATTTKAWTPSSPTA